MTKNQFEVLTQKLEEFVQLTEEQNLGDHEQKVLKSQVSQLVHYMCFWVED